MESNYISCANIIVFLLMMANELLNIDINNHPCYIWKTLLVVLILNGYLILIIRQVYKIKLNEKGITSFQDERIRLLVLAPS